MAQRIGLRAGQRWSLDKLNLGVLIGAPYAASYATPYATPYATSHGRG